MAQLVLGVAGAAVGSLFGAPQLGWMIGVGLGSALAPKQKYEQPQIEDLRLPRVELGQPLTWVAGSPVTTGNVIYGSIKRPIRHTESAGGKGGGAESSYSTYEIDLYIKPSENQIAGVSRVWKNGDLVYGGGVTRSGIWSEMRVYTGEEGQVPDPDFEAAVGAEKAQAHLGCGAVFIKSLQLDSGGNLPVLKFEVGTALETDYSAVKYVFNPTGSLPSFVDSSIYARVPVFSGGTSPSADGEFEVPSVSTYSYVTVAPSGSIGSAAGDFCLEFDLYINSSPTDDPYVYTYLRCGGLSMAIAANHQSLSIYFGQINVSDGITTLNVGMYDSPEINALFADLRGKTHDVVYIRVGPISQIWIDDVLIFNVDYSGTVYWDSVAGRFKDAYSGIFDGEHQFGNYGGSPIARRGFKVKNLRLMVGRSPYSLNSGRYIKSLPLENYWQSSVLGSQVPVTLESVVSALMLRAGYAAEQFDVTALESITKPVRGLAISRLTSTRSVLELLATTHAFTWQKRGFQIVFLPRVVDVVATVPFEDLGVSTSPTADKHPFELQFASELELPAQISVTYPNMLNDYQPDTQLSDWILSQQQSVESIELAVGMTPAEAKAVANSIQLDRLAALGKTTVSVTRKWAHIEPNDVINVLDQDGRSFRLRVGDVRDHMLYIEWDVVLDDVNATLNAAITDGGHTGQDTVKQAAPTVLEVLDMPLLRDADNAPGYWVAAGPGEGDLWPGASVLRSWDGVSYSVVAETPDAAVLGTATTVLGDWTGGNVFDLSNTVTISINGEASSFTRAAMINDSTLGVWLIGNEVVRASTATLVSEGVYVLSNLIRGFRGTEWAMGTHEVGERVVLLNSAIRRVESQLSHIGLERQMKGVTAGLALSTATPQAFTDTGIALKPFRPANPCALASGSDLVVTWQRRTRMSYRYGGVGPVVPLGEATEEYRVRIYDGATLVRTEAVTSPAYTYAAADMATDGFASADTVTFEICQMSAVVGAGYPATVTGTAP